jgi:hypothetical protein
MTLSIYFGQPRRKIVDAVTEFFERLHNVRAAKSRVGKFCG